MLEIAEPGAAILFLDRDSVQAERAEFRPEISGELVGLVDFVGARRNLMAGEVVNGFAQCVRGLAKIEVEDPIRVGNHVGRPSGNKVSFSHSLIPCASACHGRLAEKRFPPLPPASSQRAENASNSLLP